MTKGKCGGNDKRGEMNREGGGKKNKIKTEIWLSGWKNFGVFFFIGAEEGFN
jgi:hypothetical protein